MTEPYPFPTSADEFADKRVLVTGGTRGIGAAVVRRFQLAGARVVATARSASAHSMDGVLFIPADIGTAAGAKVVKCSALCSIAYRQDFVAAGWQSPAASNPAAARCRVDYMREA